MKFIIKSMVVSLLISSILVHDANAHPAALVLKIIGPAVTVITAALGFGKKISSANKENNLRFYEISGMINSLANLSQTEVSQYSSEIIVALSAARDRYDGMVLDMRAICAFNVDSRSNYFHYVEAPLKRANLTKEVGRRLDYLTEMVNVTIKETSHAKDVVKHMHDQITSISGKLIYIQEQFTSMARQKRAELQENIEDEELRVKNAEWKFLFITVKDTKEARAALANKDALTRKVEILNRFIDDTKAYIDWLQQTTTELRQAAQVRGEDASEMWGTAKGKKTLTESLIKIVTQDEDTEDTRKYVFSAIDKAVNDIADQSEAFIKNTKTENTFMNRIRRIVGNNANVLSIEGPQDKKSPTNEVNYKIVENKINIMIVLPMEKSLLKYASASFPYLDRKTIRKVAYISLLFETGIDILDNLRVIYRSSINDLVRELKKVSSMKTMPFHLHESLSRSRDLEYRWVDSVTLLHRMKAEWNAFLGSNERNCQTVIQRGNENNELIKQFVDDKTSGVVRLLRSFENETLTQITSMNEQLNSLAGIDSRNNFTENMYLGINVKNNTSIPAEIVAKEMVDDFVRLFGSEYI